MAQHVVFIYFKIKLNLFTNKKNLPFSSFSYKKITEILF